ncbi:MAG: hypothetical protein H0S84_07160 [Bacteroidales bacterium]|nr:hypothetical protein [Bacteroidales bacterium]
MGKFIELLAKDILELGGYETEEMMHAGLLQPGEARKWVVVRRYYQLVKQGMSGIDAKRELSYKYGLSISTIEKLIYGQNKKV